MDYSKHLAKPYNLVPVSFSLGVSSGAILVFDVPSKGSNITLSEVLEEHKESITDMASECSGSQVWYTSRGPVCVLIQCEHCLWPFVHARYVGRPKSLVYVLQIGTT